MEKTRDLFKKIRDTKGTFHAKIEGSSGGKEFPCKAGDPSSIPPKQALHVCMLSCFSCVQIFVTLWTVVCQTPLSMVLSKQ